MMGNFGTTNDKHPEHYDSDKEEQSLDGVADTLKFSVLHYGLSTDDWLDLDSISLLFSGEGGS